MSRSLRLTSRPVTIGGAAWLAANLLLAACVESNAPVDLGNEDATAALAGGGSGGGKDITYPTTLVISDSDNGTPLLVQSDGKGTYAPTRYITNKLVQWSTGQSTWQATLYYGARYTPTDRTIFFSLTEPTSSTNPPPPFQQAYATAHVIAKCWIDNINLLALPVGGVAACPGAMRFQAANGRWYRLAFNPDNYAEVDRIQLTCLSSDSLGCKSWRATPNGTTLIGSDPNAKGVQRLLEIDPNGDTVLADLGGYYISFKFVISR